MVHCARCLPEGVMALALKASARVPFACYVHGEDVTTATSSRELRWLVHRVLRTADFVIANSRNTERILREEWGLPDGRIRVLYPGVDTKRFIPAPRDPDIRGRLGWHDRPVVLTVGRLQKRKGHDQMIQALRSARRAIPDVLYAIVGDGEERAPLQALTAREGLSEHVQFLGEVGDEELIRCYQQCDLFVLPNRQVGRDIEGFGMVLLEAQACGKPVIAGASGGTAETMDIPATGRVVGCDTPDDLAALVAEMLSDRDRLRAMGGAARAWVCERFDWDALGRQAEDLFEHNPSPRAAAPVCRMKAVLKSAAFGFALALVLPAFLLYRLGALAAGPVRAFPGWSQLFCSAPGADRRLPAAGVLSARPPARRGGLLDRLRDGLFAPHRRGRPGRPRGVLLLPGGRDAGGRRAAGLARLGHERMPPSTGPTGSTCRSATSRGSGRGSRSAGTPGSATGPS